MIRIHILVILSIASLSSLAYGNNRPNIVWLVSEDSSMHYFEHYFPGGAPTPNISALAAHGLTYQHAFSMAPVCSVARTTLITGCYAPRIGTQYHRRSVSAPMPDGLKMFPAYLRDAGYYTTNREKKDYNADETNGTWDESSKAATWRNRKAGQPFFHMQSFTTSHESSLHFTEAEMRTDKLVTATQSIAIAPYHPDTELFRYTAARYRDRIRQIDAQIGEVIAELANDGLLEDTFIFYFGDHGGVLPRGKGYAYESGLHIPLVIRVPDKYRSLVDAPDGTRIDGFVSFVDFGPTTLNLAGASFPNTLVDGQAFLGSGISTASVNQRQSAIGYADRFDEKYDLVRTLRIGKYEYVRSYQPFNFDGLHNGYRYKMLAYQEWRDLHQSGKLNSTQSQFFERRPAELLFDCESDPHEIKNLAADPSFAEVLSKMRSELQQRLKRYPDLSFYPESYLADAAFANPTAFGKSHQAEIASLIDVADLELLPWNQAEPALKTALASPNPWLRYWGCIAATSFGKDASPLMAVVKKLASNDEQLLVRTRAAEFLGLNQLDDPRPILVDCIAKSRSGIELGLIFNTVVLLQDSKPGYKIEVNTENLSAELRSNDVVQRRLEYLTGKTPQQPKKKDKKKG
jgi:arylsulfatase A-like enzyme